MAFSNILNEFRVVQHIDGATSSSSYQWRHSGARHFLKVANSADGDVWCDTPPRKNQSVDNIVSRYYIGSNTNFVALAKVRGLQWLPEFDLVNFQGLNKVVSQQRHKEYLRKTIAGYFGG